MTELQTQAFELEHDCDTDDRSCVVLFTDPEYGCEYFLTDAWRASPTLTPRTGTSCFPTEGQEPLLQPTQPNDPVVQELEEVFEHIDTVDTKVDIFDQINTCNGYRMRSSVSECLNNITGYNKR